MKDIFGKLALVPYMPQNATEAAKRAASEQLAKVYPNKFAVRARAASRPQA